MPGAKIILPKSPTFFCKVVEIFHFAREIIFWANFIDIWRLSTGHTVEFIKVSQLTNFPDLMCLKNSMLWILRSV